MPGSLVSDANDIVLHNAAVSTNSNSTAVSTAGLVLGCIYRLQVVVGTPITDADETLNITLQGSDASNFTTGNQVPYARLLIIDADEGLTYWVEFRPQHQYIRCNFVVGGTTPSIPVTITVREQNFKVTKDDASGQLS